MSGCHGGQLDEEIVAQGCDRFQGHVSGALHGPFIVLLKEDGTDQAGDGLVVGEIYPSRLVADNVDYPLLGRENAELATATVTDERMSNGLKKGTLVLLDTSMREELPSGRLIVRERGSLTVSTKVFGKQVESVVGRVVYMFGPP